MSIEMYKRKSLRFKNFDYSQNGLYYLTICVHDRECLFGEVKKLTEEPFVELNQAGLRVLECWLEIPNHFPNVILHDYIVMPNHVHGIIEIINEYVVGAENFLPLRNDFENKFQHIIPYSIGSIVKGFKICVTKWFRQSEVGKIVWQRNYYEHIIRDSHEYQMIRDYIRDNPKKWFENHQIIDKL